MTQKMMAANIEGLARFTRGKGHSCEMFTQGREKILGPRFSGPKIF